MIKSLKIVFLDGDHEIENWAAMGLNVQYIVNIVAY